MSDGRSRATRCRAVSAGAARAMRARMPITTFMILRELAGALERNHRLLRTTIEEPAEVARFDRLAQLTLHRARAAIDVFEDEPEQERPAIGAMYAACDAGLRLLEAMAQVPADGAHKK